MKANYKNKQKVNGEIQFNLYDLNKQVIVQLPDYTEEDINSAYQIIDEFGKGKTWCMLLGKEIGYYTVFHHLIKDADETFASAVLDCCKYLGTIKSIGWTNPEIHDSIEIWIVKDEQATVLYLFNYEEGVIECQM